MRRAPNPPGAKHPPPPPPPPPPLRCAPPQSDSTAAHVLAVYRLHHGQLKPALSTIKCLGTDWAKKRKGMGSMNNMKRLKCLSGGSAKVVPRGSAQLGSHQPPVPSIHWSGWGLKRYCKLPNLWQYIQYTNNTIQWCWLHLNRAEMEMTKELKQRWVLCFISAHE